MWILQSRPCAAQCLALRIFLAAFPGNQSCTRLVHRLLDMILSLAETSAVSVLSLGSLEAQHVLRSSILVGLDGNRVYLKESSCSPGELTSTIIGYDTALSRSSLNAFFLLISLHLSPKRYPPADHAEARIRCRLDLRQTTFLVQATVNPFSVSL